MVQVLVELDDRAVELELVRADGVVGGGRQRVAAQVVAAALADQRVRRHQPAGAVEPVVGEGGAEIEPHAEIAVAVLAVAADIRAEALADVLVVEQQAGEGAEARPLLVGGAGDDVDDAARGAVAVEGGRALDDLDARDAGGVDQRQLAREAAQRRDARHAVDQHLEVAPAQRLAGARDGAGGGREVGDPVAEEAGDVAARLLDDLLALDDLDAAGNGALERRRAQRLDDDRLEGELVLGPRRQGEPGQEGGGRGGELQLHARPLRYASSRGTQRMASAPASKDRTVAMAKSGP